MQGSSIDIPLHDIKPLVAVPDNSLYYLGGMSALIVVTALIGGFYLWRFLTREKPRNLRQEARDVLEHIDVSNPKASAYAITKYGAMFRDDSPRHHEVFDNLNRRLNAYKYQEHVDAIDDETLGYFNIYLGMCDV